MPVQLLEKPETELKDVAAPPVTTPSFIDAIPLKLVLWMASPYLAGQTAEESIKRAHLEYRTNRYSSTIDVLGEDAVTREDCDRYVAAYKSLIESVATQPLPCSRSVEQMTVSFKPSMFSVVPPGPGTARRLEEAYDRIKDVVDYAQRNGVRMTLEAEDHRWTDFHLESYFSLINEGYSNLGTVLQSRLFRTQNDLKRFDDRMRVRLVIGIYQEPAQIGETQKPVMKKRLVDYAADLSARGTYVEIASHDEAVYADFVQRVAIPQKLPASQFETQFLLGVPRKDLQQNLVSGKYFVQLSETVSGNARNYLAELAHSGVLVRMYLPFGTDKVAAPYCKRRLKGNPNMIAYGIKNLFHLR